MIKLFAGTNNTALAKEVAKKLDSSLANAEILRFDNSEVRVKINEDVKDQVCVVIQPTSNPTDSSIMELLFFCDALKRSEAKKVIALIPYFGYARQNIQHREGEDVSAHVVIKMLESVGYDEIWTIDLHDEGTQGIFSVPFKHLTALPLLAKHIQSQLKEENVAIVSPDQGGVERARIFADVYFAKKESDITIVEKKRDLEHKHQSEAVEMFGNVKGKIAIIVDDIVTSGGTLINAAELCKKNGATKILAAIVHHDLSVKAPKKIQDSIIEKFYTTNSIELKKEQQFPKLEEISVASLIAESLKKTS